MNKSDFAIRISGMNMDWCIYYQKENKYLWDDLTLHKGTKLTEHEIYPGYYQIKQKAEETLRRYLAMNIEITAKIDGKPVPLSEISDETFHSIKCSKISIEDVPFARTATYGDEPRLVLKNSEEFRDYLVRHDGCSIIVIDLETEYGTNYFYSEDELYAHYGNIKPVE